MLYNEDRGALGTDFLKGFENVLDDEGRKTEARLVKEKHLGACHKRSCDSEHLLLAAREGVCLLLESLLQSGKELQNALHILLGFRLGLEAIGTRTEIFLHGESRENKSALGGHVDAHSRDLAGALLGDILAIENNAALCRLDDSAKCAQSGGLAGTVCAEKSDYIALLYIQVYTSYCLNGAVIDLQVSDFK